MSDDPRTLPIEELEASVRTASFLQSLGVRTVGELLALPEIRAPHRLVAAELQVLFEGLDLVYEGRLEGPAPRVASLQASGDVAQRWATISAWLNEHRPGALEGFRPPASAEAIAAAEEALGHTLPDDYKAFLRIHDGQEPDSPMVRWGSLLPIDEVVELYTNGLFGEEQAIDEEGVAEGVQPVELHPAWIPISTSPRGRDHLCLDLAPTAKGTRGQVIEYVVDDDQRPLVAKSFADLLMHYFTQLQTGELDEMFADDDDDEDD